ncbi:MAG TPA: hypothetical protein VIQ03_14810 [Gammaproteobacteria bacterium]
MALLPTGAIAAPTEQNSTEAVYKFQLKLAARGHAPAQYKLGMLYETGRGIPLNVEFAKEWYRRSAAQDYKPAINRLVYLDIVQNGMNDSHKSWLDQIDQEAKAGDGEAQFLLGQMYAKGVAKEQNFDTAILLLRKASGNNIPGAEEELLRVEKQLSQRQAKEAEQQRLAEEKQKQLAEQKTREARQARLLAIEEQKKRAARQKQIEREQLRKQQQAELQRKKLQAEKEAQRISVTTQPVSVTPDPGKPDAGDICSGSNRFLPTCR